MCITTMRLAWRQPNIVQANVMDPHANTVTPPFIVARFITPEHAAWLAGIVDANGRLTVSGDLNTVTLSILQANPDALQLVRDVSFAHTYCGIYPSQSPIGRPGPNCRGHQAHNLVITSEDGVRAAILLLRPYLQRQYVVHGLAPAAPAQPRFWPLMCCTMCPMQGPSGRRRCAPAGCQRSRRLRRGPGRG